MYCSKSPCSSTNVPTSQIACRRQFGSNSFGKRFNINLRKGIDPFTAIVKFFTPGPIPKPTTPQDKARLKALRFKKYVVLPGLFLGLSTFFYQEIKERDEIIQEKQRTYEKRKEMSVARYRAAMGEARWEKERFITAPGERKVEDRTVSGLEQVRTVFEKVIEGEPALQGVLSASVQGSQERKEEVLRERMRSEAEKSLQSDKEALRRIYEGTDNGRTSTLLGQISGRN